MNQYLMTLIVLTTIAIGCSPQEDSSDTKIIGGRLADYHPFMIRMSDQDENQKTGYCGGSWIAEGVILTAAHCVADMEDLAKVSVGIMRETDISATNSVKVKAIIAHPDFDPSVMHHDVALLFVEPINPDGLVKPVIPVPLNTDRNLPEELGMTTVIGWGNESSYGFIFGDELRQVDVPVIGLDKCRSAGGAYATISDNEICAGDFEQGAIDSCQGDSGGPLIAVKDGHPVLVGVVSWGINCANKEKPGVYARVSSYTDWIYQQIGAFNAPVFANKHSISDAVDQHCYTGFKSIKIPYQDDISFEIKTRYKLEGDLQQQSYTTPSADPNPAVGDCKFNRSGLGDITVTIEDIDDANPKATVTLPNLGQMWSMEATADRMLETPCTNADGDAFRLEYSLNDNNWLRAEGKWYRIKEDIDTPDLSGYSAKTCTTHGTTITFYQKTDTDVGTTSYLAAVASSELKTALTFHELSPSSSGSFVPLKVDLTFEQESLTKGTFTVVNNSKDDVHTWIIECPTEFSLRDIYGVEYPALRKSENLFAHSFVTPVSKHGIIAGEGSITFAAEFKLPFEQSTFEACEINGMNFPFTVNNVSF